MPLLIWRLYPFNKNINFQDWFQIDRIVRKKGKVAALRQEVEAVTGNGLSPSVKWVKKICAKNKSH